jgi:hypothetical protein
MIHLTPWNDSKCFKQTEFAWFLQATTTLHVFFPAFSTLMTSDLHEEKREDRQIGKEVTE